MTLIKHSHEPVETAQSRRDFLRRTVASAGTVYLTGSAFITATAADKPAASNAGDQVLLGKTGIKTSLLAQGTGYNGSARHSDHTRMGKPAFETLLRRSLDNGVRFIDTADLYGTHSYIRDVLKQCKRDELVILSKLWPRKEYWNNPSANGKTEVERFCRELGTDRLDIVLLHCASSADWNQTYADLRAGLAELKQKGTLRATGVSCHDLGALKTAASDPWVDVIFARINHKGGPKYSMDGSLEEVSGVLKTARANGKAVVGMKIFGAGKLTTPDEMDASLKHVFSNQLVDAITIGMKTPAEVDDTVQRIEKALKSA